MANPRLMPLLFICIPFGFPVGDAKGLGTTQLGEAPLTKGT